MTRERYTAFSNRYINNTPFFFFSTVSLFVNSYLLYLIFGVIILRFIQVQSNFECKWMVLVLELVRLHKAGYACYASVLSSARFREAPRLLVLLPQIYTLHPTLHFADFTNFAVESFEAYD